MNNDQQHGGYGGLLDEFREMIDFFRKHREDLDVILPLVRKRLEKIERDGGIAVAAFGTDIVKVKV